jgi:hypothetical protein
MLVVGGLGGASTIQASQPVPPNLPRYALSVQIDTHRHVVHLRQRVTWTNRHDRPTNQLVFNVHSHYTVQPNEVLLLAKTLELLRLSPSFAINEGQTPGQVVAVQHESGAPLAFHYQPDISTALVVNLPDEVASGQSVTVELTFRLDLPNKQGRWGYWEGVTTLSNWCPVLAYYDNDGWQPTPFIPWHQPWFNEAGHFTATILVPDGQTVACTARLRSVPSPTPGWSAYASEPIVSRDFAILCSDRYRETTGEVSLPDGRTVTVRCLAFPEHAKYAREMVRISSEAIATFSQWFGPYPYPQFTIAESYFGFNGNECSGLIMIDQRVFALPQVALGYVEYLVTHETCHQWWYNVIGSHGYRETWVDEGFTTYLSHRLLDRKLGKNNLMVNWPEGLRWLPSISRENYRYSTFFNSVLRNERRPTVQELPKYDNVFGLFTGAYDRGSKVVGLIEEQLGETAFLDFTRLIYRKYYFRILRVADVQRELEAYTGRSWAEFFRTWVYSADMTDWAIERVRVRPLAHAEGPQRVSVTLRQQGDVSVPTVVGIAFDKQETYELRVPLLPQADRLDLPDLPGTLTRLDANRYRLELVLPRRPSQISVDPDKVTLDRDPLNNHWHKLLNPHLTPAYTFLEETSLTTDYDRVKLTGGLWLYSAAYPEPWYMRSALIGARGGLYSSEHFWAGLFTAYRTDFRDIVVGADGEYKHWPFPKSSVGFHVERRIANPIGVDASTNVNRAVVYGRYIFIEGGGFYTQPTHYADLFANYQENPLPFARQSGPGAVRPQNITTGGIHYRIDLRTPYWDPELGFRIDLSYAGGSTNLNGLRPYHQWSADFSAARKLPDELGWFSDIRLAGRFNVTGALPDQGEFFALGGSMLFRGFDLAQRQGNLLWVANAEARLPLLARVEYNCLDNVVGLRALYLATFYDVGEIYVNGRSVGGVAHALGLGLRADVSWFSFIERTTLRLDLAKTINENSPWQLWLGFVQPF